MKASLLLSILVPAILLSAAPTPKAALEPASSSITEADGPIARAILTMHDLMARETTPLEAREDCGSSPYQEPCKDAGSSIQAPRLAIAGLFGSFFLAGLLL